MDFEDYQKNLVTGAGVATALITALPLAILLAPVAGLAAAYITHRYAEDHAQHIIKRKNEGLLPNAQSHMEKQGTVDKFYDFFAAKSKKVYLLGMVLAGIAGLLYPLLNTGGATIITTSELIWWLIAAIVAWNIYYMLITVFLSLTVGLFIQMLNRVVFSPEWTQEQYKRWVMVSSGLFTLVITPVAGLFFGAPILAIIAMLAARDYADWHFEGELIDKAKRDASRLTEGYTDSDEEVADEAEMPDEQTSQDYT
jgi:hypothetical protein